MSDLKLFLQRIEQFMDRVEPLLPPLREAVNFSEYSAFRWVRHHNEPEGYIEGIANPVKISFDAIQSLDRQVKVIRQNTEQFLNDLPANNVLLTGSRGTGKSSLVKASLNQYAKVGLKMIEIDSDDLVELPQLLRQIDQQPYKFIIFCDDLSFEDGDPAYKSLKALLDGSLISPADNVLIYATSNRRHLLPEYMEENLQASKKGGEIHPGEAIEEKISLSERFGLWVSFYPFSQNEYLGIIENWLNRLAPDIPYTDELTKEALQFSLQRGSRSGRVAQQFIRHYIGSYRLKKEK